MLPARPPPRVAPRSAAAGSPMAPKKTPKGKSGFFRMRAKPSGNFGLEFSDAGRRWWLGTYPAGDVAARAYDAAVCHARQPKMDLNFPEVESQAVA